jgi:hypothetical protein
MADTDHTNPTGRDKHRDDIPVQIIGSLNGALRVATDPSKFTAIQLQFVAGDAARGVLALTLDGALDLTFRLIAAAGEVRRAQPR